MVIVIFEFICVLRVTINSDFIYLFYNTNCLTTIDKKIICDFRGALISFSGLRFVSNNVLIDMPVSLLALSIYTVYTVTMVQILHHSWPLLRIILRYVQQFV